MICYMTDRATREHLPNLCAALTPPADPHRGKLAVVDFKLESTRGPPGSAEPFGLPLALTAEGDPDVQSDHVQEVQTPELGWLWRPR